MLRILDSDHVAALDRGGELAEGLRQRLRASGDKPVVTIVTPEEQLRGWLAQIKRAATPDAEIQAYEKLLTRFRFFERWTILPLCLNPASSRRAARALARSRARCA
jgi:tRNA(fMet)-specific endonuclease VapC